ncbi:TIGR02391 family protein [Boudabousia marimammalium]|uniref:Conserved hypothetical protein CHP02391 domain-containing protein n=1 Tax=Boudabousia marimammalium TaxID=156892 RepID=A0A1Q5PSQ5_9ACTO|nr:TIGR02391 family protein [Boudabousia marimammalium]OKL50475.1 hypothetical protein BM477_00425 [Boudabousia marimammalium]
MRLKNPEQAADKLKEFVEVTKQVVPDASNGIVYLGTVMKGRREDADRLSYIVEKILDRATPDWRQNGVQGENDGEYKWLRTQALRGIAAIESEIELSSIIGDDGPTVAISNLHPWAWENASSLWMSGYYRQAVLQTAVKINAETQNKLNRKDLSDAKLFQQAFSLAEAEKGKPRLRLSENDGSDSYKSLHEGARALGEALYKGVRNLNAHDVASEDEEDEQLCVEQLAAFSLLARWVDKADVVEKE